MPVKEAEPTIPWNWINLDLIGPYNVKTPNKEWELQALTMIDPTTGWFKVKDIERPDAASVMAAFDDTWLSRYPRPEYIGFDNGSDYKNVFDIMCSNYGLKKKLSTAYNPQSNGIVKCIHQVLADALHTFELEK